ncbi:MAG: DUF5107 domain-containing protein [Planctomycetota bacterium]|nr:DUF5107 domain-containing protein [Planctomycetota bacterium]
MSGVRVYEEMLRIPTYVPGQESPYANFFAEGYGRIYPYTMIDGIPGRKENVGYKVVQVENEHLKATVIPGLGGRIWGMSDKRDGSEVFYRNRTIKPAMIGLAGAWIATGVEFNFPVGHTVVGFRPVDYALISGEDGFAGVQVGDTDRATGMTWRVTIGMRPGIKACEVRVRLYNGTSLGRRFYYWENAAVKASDELEFISDGEAAWARGKVDRFPVTEDGVDLGLHSSYREATDCFTMGGRRDFFGCYDHGTDRGVIHVADIREAPGRKFFTWGHGERAAVWTEVLSDGDGQYIEIQRGRTPTQADFTFLEPGEIAEWTGWWFPVRGLRGVADACAWGAFNAVTYRSGAGQVIRIFANAIRPMQDVRFALVDPIRGVRLFDKTVSLGPGEGCVLEEAAGEARPEDCLVRVEHAGRVVAEFPPRPPRTGTGSPASVRSGVTAAADRSRSRTGGRAEGKASRRPTPRTDRFVPEPFRIGMEKIARRGRDATPSELLREAVVELKQDAPERAAALLEKVLEADPCRADALVWLGRIRLWAFRYADAAALLEKAALLEPEHPRADFYLGVAMRGIGRPDEAREAFQRAARRGVDLAHAARVELFRLADVSRDSEGAIAIIESAVGLNPRAARPRAMLAAALRRAGRLRDAETAARAALALDASEFMAMNELRLVAGAGGDAGAARVAFDAQTAAMGRTPSNYADLALDYAACSGFLEEADGVMRIYESSGAGGGKSGTMASYCGAWIASLRGDAGRSAAWLERAKAEGPDGVYPDRPEHEAALRYAVDRDGEDACAFHLLGNLYASRFRTDEAARLWRKALALRPGSVHLLRNLAMASLHEKRDARTAFRLMRKACRLAGDDHRLLCEADHVASVSGDVACRAGLWKNFDPSLLRHNDLRARYLRFLVESGRYVEADRILKVHTFYSAEGAFTIQRLWEDTYIRLALIASESGDHAGALRWLANLDARPRNLLVDFVADDAVARRAVVEGDIRLAMRDRPGARAAWERGAAVEPVWWRPCWYFKGLCMKRLGDRKGLTKLIATGRERLAEGKIFNAWIGQAEQNFFDALLLVLEDGRKAARKLLRLVLDTEPFHSGARWLLEKGDDVF